ncbi:MAG TPA: enolase C-terminal domain-like protein [Jatrophihabitans sp.]|nr:enolase C-terminal domain-like protein [Jatrophihabitans sp.]
MGCVADLPRVCRLSSRAVDVPLSQPVHTSAGTLSSTPMVLLDLHTDDGLIGRSYLRCYTRRLLRGLWSVLEDLAELVVAKPAGPAELAAVLGAEFALPGNTGLVGLASSGIDMCAWDLAAQRAGQPLCKLLHGTPQPVPAYASVRSMAATAAAAEAVAAADQGYCAVKLKIGRADPAADIATIEQVRAAVGDQVAIMVDYNQRLSVDEALDRLPILDSLGLLWIEEPTSADDYPGHARIAAAASTPIALGENCWSPAAVSSMLALQACDRLVLDLTRIGGVTGWLAAAALPVAAGMPLANHTFPEVSIHLLATAGAPVWLESIDHAGPILREPLRIQDGYAVAPSTPGTGIDWDSDAVARWLVG